MARIGMALCASLLAALIVASTAHARTSFAINVTAGSADHAEGEGGIEYCTPGGEAGTSEECPLRAALEEADGILSGFSVEEVVVQVPPGHYKLTKELALPLGSHAAKQCVGNPCAVTLRGSGPGATVIEASGLTPGVEVEELVDAPVAVEGVTITGGGKGIISIAQNASLAVRDTAITGGNDTGIVAFDSGPVDVVESSITDNTTGKAGGAVFAHRAKVTVARSTLAGNRASEGGAIATDEGTGEVFTVIDSTLANNSASGGGGAIWGNEVVLRHDTIAGNSAVKEGGGIATRGGIALEGSILSGNSPKQCEPVEGHVLETAGANIVFGPSCAWSGSAPIASDPRLAPLASDGGPGQTMVLLAGSPALDAAGSTCPASAFEGGPALDERGVSRPQGSGCDIGAFESRADGAVSLAASPEPVAAGATLSLTATARNAGSDALTGVQVSIPLPVGTSVLFAPPDCSAVFGPGGSFTCQAGALEPGQSRAFTVQVRPERAGALIESASVSVAQADINPADDTTTIASVVAQPSSGERGTGGSGSGEPGGGSGSGGSGAGGSAAGSALRGHTIRVDARGYLTVVLACPSTAPGGCRDAIDLYGSRGTLPATAAARASLLASGHALVTAGSSRRLRMRLTSNGRRLLPRGHRLSARSLLTASPGAGAGSAATARAAVTLIRAR